VLTWVVVGGWPMMVRDGLRRAKIIRMAHMKDKNSLINIPGTPIDRAPWCMGWLSVDGP
jgi:hypothetical protein